MNAAVDTFGVREFSGATGRLELAAESIHRLGYVVVADVLSAAELAYAREALDRLYESQVEEVGGAARLQRINDLYTIRSPLIDDPFFLDVAMKKPVLEVVQQILGSYVTLMLQNGVVNHPAVGQEQNAGAWHRDLNYQHFVSSRPLSISALFCIDSFSVHTGGTVVLPHSHRDEAFPSAEYVAANQRTIEAPAGSVLVFDSMIFHRSGLNRSEAPRRAINHMYTIPLLKPQLSYARAFGDRYADDPFLRQFLGYETEPATSAREFREMRLNRTPD